MIGKRLKNLAKKVDQNTVYSLAEAVKVIKECSTAKFDETIEIAINLNIDAKKSDQHIRGAISLPHGTGKTYRVAVFAKGPKADEAKEAGADIVGSDELVEQIQRGEFNFDRCIATPDMMALVGRVGKLLGPKGLMPNPKLGTVTQDVKSAVKAVKGGQVEYRNDKGGIIHAGVGKASFDDQKIVENIQALLDTIQKSRPAGVKGSFIKKLTLTSTMGPSVQCQMS